MTLRATGATAARVLAQLRHDRRTVALLLFVAALLMALLKGIFSGQPGTFDRVGGPLLGLFPFISMFVVTAIAMVRERLSGTLERLMTMPLAKADLLFGYGAAFALMAVVQAIVVSAVAFGLLGLDVAHSAWLVGALAVANALLGMALGLFVSAFAGTEFQAVQFVPAFITPQLLLSGLFVPRERMNDVLEGVSYALPLTYAYDALDRVTHAGTLGGRLARDVGVVAGLIVLALLLGALTLRRRTA
jgi:ABC-2 type transport system permease protein